MFHMLTGFANGSKRYFFVAVLGTALSILFSFLMPQIVGFTVDSVIGDKSAALPGFLAALLGPLGSRDFLRSNFRIRRKNCRLNKTNQLSRMIRIEQINKSKNLHHLYNLRELKKMITYHSSFLLYSN